MGGEASRDEAADDGSGLAPGTRSAAGEATEAGVGLGAPAVVGCSGGARGRSDDALIARGFVHAPSGGAKTASAAGPGGEAGTTATTAMWGCVSSDGAVGRSRRMVEDVECGFSRATREGEGTEGR